MVCDDFCGLFFIEFLRVVLWSWVAQLTERGVSVGPELSN